MIPEDQKNKADMQDVVSKSTQYVSLCYGLPSSTDMSTTRRKQWASKVGKTSRTVPPLASLTPTTEAFIENVKRAHFQASSWKHALDADPPALNTCDYGWHRNDVMKTLLPVTVPQTVFLAQPEVLQLVKCGCVSDNPCSTQIYSCAHARLPCTIFCACQRSAVYGCNNEQTVNV